MQVEDNVGLFQYREPMLCRLIGNAYVGGNRMDVQKLSRAASAGTDKVKKLCFVYAFDFVLHVAGDIGLQIARIIYVSVGKLPAQQCEPFQMRS